MSTNSNVRNRSFIGAIAEAIKAFFLLFISGVHVAEDAVAMADKAVGAARTKQTVDLGISMDNYTRMAVSNAMLEQTRAGEALKKYIDEDPSDVRRKLMIDAETRLNTLVTRELAMLEAERSSR